MDTWVPNIPSNLHVSKRKKGNVKEDVDKSRCSFPTLEVGSMSPLTVRQGKNGPEWTSLVQDDRSRKFTVAHANDQVIFPATRSPPFSMPKVSTTQKAERGAHALRTYYPDIDIPAELFREQIESEVRREDALQTLDPSLGNVMDTLYFNESRSKTSGVLAFPMGETGCDLNLSAMEFAKTGKIIFRPSAAPAQTFSTPIRQIRASSSLERPKQPSVLVIRTMASTYIYHASRAMYGPSDQPLTVRLNQLALFDRAHFGDRPIVDITATRSNESVVGINDLGEVYYGRIGHSSLDHDVAHSVRGIGKDGTHEGDLYRILNGTSDEHCLVLSSRSLAAVDFRISEISLPISIPREPKEIFTSVANGQKDSLIRLVTTSEVLWFDERYSRRPVLAYKHHREYDRGLQVSVVDVDESPLTILNSRKNGLLSIYDIHKEATDLVRARSLPQSLVLPSPYEEHLGLYFIEPPPGCSFSRIPLLRLSSRGSISQTTFSIESLADSGASIAPPSCIVAQWDSAVKEIHKMSKSLHPNLGSFGQRDHHTADLRPLYEELFLTGLESSSATADALEDVLDKMPYFWQHSDDNVDAMLTTADIAFRSGDDPSDPSRADFLTGHKLSGVRGQRALKQGQIPVKELVENAPWHTTLLPFMRRYVPDSPSSDADFQTFSDGLRKYDLKMDDYRTGPSLRRETEAREQVALDLSLASHIFAPYPFSKGMPSTNDDDALEVMSRATQAMSLDDDLPSIKFGYFKPTLRTTPYRDGDAAEDKDEQPPGVRLLLQEWDIGTDPETYEYHDPYGVDSIMPSAAALPRSGVPKQQRATPGPSQASQHAPPPILVTRPAPPPIFSASQPAPAPTFSNTQPPRVAPQPSALRKNASLDIVGPSTQEMASTQIVPGPFGGRPPVKKPAKKRIGGF
ncbi:hypothetical protein K488DRAFT_53551 [Vararia minispora EC-137]|uniref:Uncharacterized protein n=1 Tax=Vararia minispora EC-137 TaxID=1314806 RepID=A0ACB8QGD9_9AGAM|nr:hypothetical protein K488DRAFT_53551 [Vararia minispora EC-137]